MRPTKKVIVQRQIEEWEKRVRQPNAMPEKVKNENGELILVNNDTYNKAYDRKFSCIHSKNQENIYKFFRYGLEQCKVYNSNILFARSCLFDTYILPDSNIRDGYRLTEKLIETISPNAPIAGKWIVCEDLSCDFSTKLAVYLITQLKVKKALGIVFACDERFPNNLLSCIKDDDIEDVIEI